MVLTMATACSSNEASAPKQQEETSSEQGQKEEDLPNDEVLEEGLTAGLFEYTISAEGQGDYFNFIHFYENGVYYFSGYNGGQYDAGFYELADEEITYPLDKSDPEGEQGIAAQTIVFYDLAGNELVRCGYDNDTVYYFTLCYDNNFVHNPAADNDPANETGVTVEEFMIEGDEYANVLLKHNGTFLDMVFAMVEGTWSKDGNVYTLIDDDTGESYTLTVDGNSAVYVSLSGETVTLVGLSEITVILAFQGVADAAYGEMSVNVYCYEDGSAKQVVTYGGMDNSFTGTWELAEDHSLHLVIDGEAYEAALNMESLSHALIMTLNDGQDDIVIEMSAVEIEGGEASVEMTFVGEENANIVLEMYSDGTCQLVYLGMGAMSEGTWEMDMSSAMPAITIELDGEIYEADTDYATMYFFDIDNGMITDTMIMPF